MTIKRSISVVKILEFIIAMLLAGMSLLVFVNVIMRYVFHSGIIGTEDLSRFMFIWLAYIGIVVVTVDRSHLAVDLMVRCFPRKGRIGLGVASHILVIVALGLFLSGVWQQMVINHGTMAMGAIAYPLSWNYAAGVFAGTGSLIFVAFSLVKILRGDVSELFPDHQDELIEDGLHHAKNTKKKEKTK